MLPKMANRSVIQANLNHSAAAQDFLCQHAVEWGVDLVIVAEPYFVPQRGNWHGDEEGLVAVIVKGEDGAPPHHLYKKGKGYVAVDWGGLVIVGVYAPPQWNIPRYGELLDKVGEVLRLNSHRPVLVAGDLNAKSILWGSSATNARGKDTADWAIELGLHIANRGMEDTCVRHNGESSGYYIGKPLCRTHGAGMECNGGGGDLIGSPIY